MKKIRLTPHGEFRKKSIIILLFLLIASTIFGAAIQPLPLMRVKLETKDIALDPPLIRKDGRLFISIQEVAPYFKATLTYQRKEDLYTLSAKKCSLTFAPNTYEFWINHSQNFFRIPPFYYENILYVPLDDFLHALGLKAEENNNKVSITANTPESTAIPKPAESEKSNEKEEPSTGYVLLWGNQHYTLEDIFLQNSQIWANIDDISGQEGYEITFKPLKVILTKDKQEHSFALQQPNSAFMRKNGRLYANLNLFFRSLKFGFSSDKGRRFTVLSPILGVQINPHAPTQLQCLSTGSLPASKALPLAKGPGFYIDIPNSEPQCSDSITLPPPFSKAEIRALDATTTRITVYLQEARPYSPLIPASFGGDIRLYNEILSLKESKSNVIRIKASQPILYSVGLFNQPHRLVVDIPDAVSNLPLVMQVPKGVYYTRIRSSQFQVNPSMTRIVFDLTQSASFTIQKQGKILEINFDTPTAPVKVVAKPAAPLPLENRVIVIDPGHGGDDPGALSSSKEHEKEFTLDISKRLQTLLTNEGAFVIMCREKDQNPSLEERTSLANMNKTDAFISVHINSFFNPFTSGTETYYYKPKDKPLSDLIHEEMVKALGLPDKGVKKARLYVLRNSTMPATLIEPLFITNDHDISLLKQPEMRQKIAQAVTNGLLRYFKK